ncbi:MAG TPA: glycosyl hydrolase [Vicinamibacteria bacterium]|nr:glycosyl hydrolase [Vicinamibacteria bacterium]
MRARHLATLAAALLVSATPASAAPDSQDREPPKPFDGLKLRAIGPAFMSGRIADIAIDPTKPSTWYVAVGSGGVWKTANAGTTWTPLFDKEASYSIGCVTLDPSNPNVVWVGTGENVGGRHVGFGDGVYRSRDAGASWENLGLRDSQHISKIVVHPAKPEVVWVAAQGPLWSKGGERGLFETTDGGKTWTKVLGAGEWTGVTDVVIDPRNPDVLYAATWQRHRTVAAYMGGGPESGLHRSTDGGTTWEKLEKGLPEGPLGKIGLAISPQDPDVLYAAIELDRRKGAVYRSTDRGSSWEKRSDTVSGATGPHYYQELYASPHAEGRIYLVDVRMQVSDDGGKTFRRVEENDKHSDNHEVAFRADDPEYLLVGTDGGIYESFDLAKTWRFVANLPVTQFYKVAVDDAEPFYTIYGGTQDNSTQGGPSRTDTSNGITSADWFITLFADGHQPATEPGNPSVMYSEWQQGNLVRVDRTTGERVYIQPQPEPGDPPERFNWDAPILVSPHSPKRVYYASQRVWRSDDRGDSWRPVSGDLTRNQDRMTLPLMGRRWSWDSPWDMVAMSAYDTITSLAESPKLEGLLYAGTDDGLIHVSEDGGRTWRKVEVGSIPGVPATAFVNDVKADLFDASTVYAAVDDHKSGDFRPYLFKSTDRGRSWRSIAGDLPDRHLVWRVVQDHVKPDLLFAGTEFGIFFTTNGGARWAKLTGGVPTISFRDLSIQRRENDLVGASFGRGFYVLDDYSALREVGDGALAREAGLFPVRKAWWYVERDPLGEDGKASQGAAFFTADNPPFGAVFTYHLARDIQSREKARQEKEKPLLEAGKDTPFPGWAEVEAERREEKPVVVLTVKDEAGNVVRRIEGETKKGFHRVSWDLRLPPTEAIGSRPADDEEGRAPRGVLVAPGIYTVSLAKQVDGETTGLAGPVRFEVARLRPGALPGAPPKDTAAFLAHLAEVSRATSAAGQVVSQALKRVETLGTALERSRSAPDALDTELHTIRQELHALDERLAGNRARASVEGDGVVTIARRVRVAQIGTSLSTYGPTPTHRRSLEIAEQELAKVREQLNAILEQRLPALEKKLDAAGAPWTPGRPVPPLP